MYNIKGDVGITAKRDQMEVRLDGISDFWLDFEESENVWKGAHSNCKIGRRFPVLQTALKGRKNCIAVLELNTI